MNITTNSQTKTLKKLLTLDFTLHKMINNYSDGALTLLVTKLNCGSFIKINRRGKITKIEMLHIINTEYLDDKSNAGYIFTLLKTADSYLNKINDCSKTKHSPKIEIKGGI